MKRRLTAWFVATLALLMVSAQAAPIQWVGNTRMWLNGQSFPLRAAYLEAFQTVTVTTETYPIGPGQSVQAMVTTDRWQTVSPRPFAFDANVGNNSRWYVVLGPYPRNTWVDFYIKAQDATATVYDNNGWQNFGFHCRPSGPGRKGAILQWFETDYRTILRRLPEVVMAGYSTIYLPPPSKGGGGGFSVGYNPFDRFDLGDRPQKGSVRTKYGTTQELIELIQTAKRLGIEVVCDVVLNHNDNRAASGINTYPDMIPEDFHIRSSADTGNAEVDFNNDGSLSWGMLNKDLVGLVDIAHEDGNNTRAGPFTLPAYASNNSYDKPAFVRNPLTPQLYPNGTPTSEDVRQYLRRWIWWLTAVVGFDGYRLDAVKHIPPAFLGWAPDQPLFGDNFANGDILPFAYAVNPELTIFGEDYTSNTYELREFAKTGMNLLDFPLKFKINDLFNSKGFADLGGIANGWGIDASTGLPFENGGLGSDVSVAFVQSHDDGPPESDNLAHALIMGRVARPKVYYDGNNVQPGSWANFPRPGRADALTIGGTLARMVDARARFGRGGIVTRWSSKNLVVLERQIEGSGVLLVGLNNRGDTSLAATVQTAFEPGTVLVDLTGQGADVVVSASRQVAITVPSNGTSGAPNNGRGYVFYAPRAPSPVAGIAPVRLTTTGLDGSRPLPLPVVSQSQPAGQYGTPQTISVTEVRTARVNLEVQTDPSGFSAAAKLDNGLAWAGLNPLAGTLEGLADGYVPMRKLSDGRFALRDVDLSFLADGLHMVRVRVFADTGSRPGVFGEFPLFLHVRRARTGVVDGDLTDMGTPLATQARTPSSNANRIDALYARNDDQYLYLGLSGRIDASGTLTNGAMLFLDTDLGGGSGIADLASLADDSGPAPRLISNTRLTAPAGFRADFAFGSVRGGTLSSSPGMPFVGSPVSAPVVGAQAAFYRLDPAKPAWLSPVPVVVGYQLRPSRNDPAKGWEVAVPLSSLFPAGLPQSRQFGMIAALGSTGEPTGTLLSTDPSRGTLGGRPAPNAWVSNQFVPTQSSVTSDPGTAPVALTSSLSVTLKTAQAAVGMAVEPGPIVSAGRRGQWTQRVVVRNTSGTTVSGPIWLVVSSGNATLLSRSGVSLTVPGASYQQITVGSLASGQTAAVQLNYTAASSGFTPIFEVRSGTGAL